MKVILLLLLSVLSVGAQMPPRVMQDLLSYRPPTGPGEFLTDRWYFSNVTETNDAQFAIAFEGTGTRVVDWGDGQSTTTNGNCTVTHTYSTAGSNVFSMRETSGITTRIYFYNLTGYQRLKRILTPPNGMVGLRSLVNLCRGCTNLTGSIPDISGLTNLTTISLAWYGCAGLTGSIPDISALTNLTTIAYAWYGCTGLTGSIPDISGLTKLTSIDSAFQNTRLTANTNTVAGIFGLLSRTNLTTANQCFSVSSGMYASLVGNAGDFIALEKSASFVTNTSSGSGSYRMFANQTNLADYATIPDDWK
jgi:hypothetical protein